VTTLLVPPPLSTLASTALVNVCPTTSERMEFGEDGLEVRPGVVAPRAGEAVVLLWVALAVLPPQAASANADPIVANTSPGLIA
jgi:hypothetical protein